MEQTAPSPQLLSIKDLIALLNLSKTTIYDLLKKGKFPKPFIQKNRCTRWKAEDVNKWLTQQEIN
ncbi:helix-turn-helix transcriptional regulator [Ursidibacter arcticus]|uniref:helix-turn-helix transcriptional regulator n=1 Tax=Ursidibacter arcticus TaxID=1524965 RepID=UPI0012FC6383|nr:helix-turn-helix domain-containing protein [Ursidibacter arcticus]KAE9531843.1 hypothetical protein A1D25_01765 [Ursidibacter arcticus]